MTESPNEQWQREIEDVVMAQLRHTLHIPFLSNEDHKTLTVTKTEKGAHVHFHGDFNNGAAAVATIHATNRMGGSAFEVAALRGATAELVCKPEDIRKILEGAVYKQELLESFYPRGQGQGRGGKAV